MVIILVMIGVGALLLLAGWGFSQEINPGFSDPGDYFSCGAAVFFMAAGLFIAGLGLFLLFRVITGTLHL
jgi:hypothetical protein